MAFISRRAANDAAIKQVALGKADGFHIQRRAVREADRSLSYGWVAVLYRRRRVIGFAMA